jgi:hypothetical protein
VGGVGAALAVEVYRRIAGVIGQIPRSRLLGLEALERSLRLDQGTVDGEVLGGAGHGCGLGPAPR